MIGDGAVLLIVVGACFLILGLLAAFNREAW